MTEHGQNTDNLRIGKKRETLDMPRVPLNLLISLLAEKGGSRTLRGPYDPQTGFEDQRHHRAPSFSFCKISYFRLRPFSPPCSCCHPVTIRKPSQCLPFADPGTSCASAPNCAPKPSWLYQHCKGIKVPQESKFLPLKEKYLADELEKFREQAANKARRDRLDEEKGLQRSYLREEILGFGARDCSAVGLLLFGRQPACEAEPYLDLLAPQQGDCH